MPWTPKDAYRHTKKANTPLLQRQWAHVANSALLAHGDDARAIEEANAVVSRHGSATTQKRPK